MDSLSSPKAPSSNTPPFSAATSRNPRLVLIAGIGVVLLVAIALIGIITGSRRGAAPAPDQHPALPDPIAQADRPSLNTGQVLPPAPLLPPAAPPSGLAGAPTALDGAPGLLPGTPASVTDGRAPERTLMSDPRAPAGAPLPPAFGAPPSVGPVVPRPERVAETYPPSPVPMLPASGRTYTVQNSDSLWKIAQKVYGNGAKWHLIAQANPGINPNRLTPGAKLRLPESAAGATLTGSAIAPAPSRPGSTSHSVVVRPGETLYAIARREYGNGEKWDVIYNANRARLPDPHNVAVGTTLTIPPRS